MSTVAESKRKKVRLSRYERGNRWFGFALTLPAIVMLCVVIALPILKGIYVSFFEYKLADLRKSEFNLDGETLSQVISGEKDISALTNYTWNNFKNYQRLFKDGLNGPFFTYFFNTVIFVFFAVSIQTVLGMMIALLLNSRIRGRGLFRGLLLVPWTIPSVVVAIIWRLMLHQEGGIMNYALYVMGLTSTTRVAWSGTVVLARAAIVIAAVWRQLPYMMVMLLAGLQSVDMSLQEAAQIDGASGRQTFIHVTIPSIRPVLISAVWIAIMSNFQMYTIIANLVGTGSKTGTNTLSIAAYQEAFTNSDFGKGAAIGVLWLVVLLIITIISNTLSARSATDYQ